MQITREVLASLVVFLVALPLCMGIAVASGVPPAMGLLSGIIGGIVVGRLAGAPLQVSGPAAGLVVLVYEVVQTHGLAVLGVVVLVAGLLQVAAGFFKVGAWFRAVAPAVIYGMLAGIGVLIVASQLHVMLDRKPFASGLANIADLPAAAADGLFPMDGSPHHLAAGVGLCALIVLFGWNAGRDRLPRWARIIPGPLVAVALATVLATALALPIRYVDVPESISGLVNLMSPGDLSAVLRPEILALAFAMALVASAESLLCAAAVDKLHSGPRADLDRELVAQGAGNALCGVLGGLPVTGVIVRSSANIEAGASTRVSGMLHGVWMLALVAFFPALLETIPVAALAAVLVYTGLKLINPKVIRELRAQGQGELLVYAVTVTAIVSTSLLEGLMIGIAVAIGKLAWTFSRLETRVEQKADGDFVIHLAGAATFVGLPKLLAALNSVPEAASVRIEMRDLKYADHAAIEAIEDWSAHRRRLGAEVESPREALQARTTPFAA